MSDKVTRASQGALSAPNTGTGAADKAAPRFVGSGPADSSATIELQYPLEWNGQV